MKKIFYFIAIIALTWACNEEEDPKIDDLKVTYETTNVSIKGGADGAIDLAVTGGETPYTFQWSNGASTEDLSNIMAGTYGVTITDKSNQTISENITVEDSEIDSLKIILTGTKVSSEGGTDGAIDLTIMGGLAPFAIEWSNGETTEDLTNISAGIYSVTVTDDLNQVASAEYTLTELIVGEELLSMSADYTMDVYYSLTNGVVKTGDRSTWDIAFYTNPMTSTIIINDGAGVNLYMYPNGDKDDWETVDITGVELTSLFNNYMDTSWQFGAFDVNALGHPDYGWGVYDMTTHSVYGDSIHIIKLQDGSMKKLFIEKRESTTNTFHIKYADLDGSNEQTAEISAANHLDKNLIHFSLSSNQVIEYEPASNSWDLMFTKYFDQTIPYNVTGVLSNNGIKTAKSDTLTMDYMSLNYSNIIASIGYDWKEFNMDTYVYDIVPNVVYFVQDRNDTYHKIQFTNFEGSSTGNIEFIKTTY